MCKHEWKSNVYTASNTSLHIDFDQFNWCQFLIMATATRPDINVVSCGGGQLHIEPWW